MRLPKRTAFARPDIEIPHLYSLFYPPPHLPPDMADSARHKGISLVQGLYLSRSGGCPIAIEVTASLVAGVLLDHSIQGAARAAGPHAVTTFHLSLRQTLSLCVIRLVNSLADSLQSGKFARSIASIAEKELALPQWLVEFRHRATHEVLPSIEVCREAAVASLNWLQSHYWSPTLQSIEACRRDITLPNHSVTPSAGPSSPPTIHPRHQDDEDTALRLRVESFASLLPILQSYKLLCKEIVRDQSLKGRSKSQLEAILQELDEWHQHWQVRLPARSEPDDHQDASHLLFPAGSSPTQYILTSALLIPGTGIVPLSKLKRSQRSAPELPASLRETWMPLVDHLRSQQDEHFVSLLLAHIVSIFSNRWVAGELGADPRLVEEDPSYAHTLQAWAAHLLALFDSKPAEYLPTQRHLGRRAFIARKAARTLLLALIGPAPDDAPTDDALLLLTSASRTSRTLAFLDALLPLCRAEGQSHLPEDWDEEYSMLERLIATVRRLHGVSPLATRKKATDSETSEASSLPAALSEDYASTRGNIKRRRGGDDSDRLIYLSGFEDMASVAPTLLPAAADNDDYEPASAKNAATDVDPDPAALLRMMEGRYAALLRDGIGGDSGNKNDDDDDEVEIASCNEGGEEGSENSEDEPLVAGADEADVYYSSGNDEGEDETDRAMRLPPGWRIASTASTLQHDTVESGEEVWTPTPIGCFKGRVPDFLGLESLGPTMHTQGITHPSHTRISSPHTHPRQSSPEASVANAAVHV